MTGEKAERWTKGRRVRKRLGLRLRTEEEDGVAGAGSVGSVNIATVRRTRLLAWFGRIRISWFSIEPTNASIIASSNLIPLANHDYAADSIVVTRCLPLSLLATFCCRCSLSLSSLSRLSVVVAVAARRFRYRYRCSSLPLSLLIVCNFDIYRSVRAVHIGSPVYRYADCPLPGDSTKNRSSAVSTVGGRLKGEIDRRRSIKRGKGKKKKKRKRKKRGRIPNARVRSLPVRRHRSCRGSPVLARRRRHRVASARVPSTSTEMNSVHRYRPVSQTLAEAIVVDDSSEEEAGRRVAANDID
ncbi:hypothetical protein GW17_00041421 [Ensete ventricosum]|nr:hypothetical protein GW17_00041421 [Ensete ventricosum]